MLQQKNRRMPALNDILDQHYLSVANLGLEIVEYPNRILVLSVTAVTGELNEGDFRWQVELPNQVG
jgi:hypothetical protein